MSRELAAQATEVTLERPFTPRICPDGRASYDWLPPWQETPLEPSEARPVPPPPPKPPVHPVLTRASEPLFSRLANVLARESGQPEPDVAVERERVRLLWPQRPPMELRPARATPWFHVVDPSADPTHTAAVLRALPQVFATDPWQEADVPSVSHPVVARPRWPHLTLAALGLVVLLAAAWRVARRRRARAAQ